MCGGNDAVYQMFSGGREGYCPTCDDNFLLDPNAPDAPRAVLLQTALGREQLRRDMHAHLDGLEA